MRCERDVTRDMKRPFTLTMAEAGEACAEFRIGIRSLPYLADHAFQDMVVLPGSFYVEMARCVDRELTQRLPAVIHNVIFQSPVILGSDDIVIGVDVRDVGGGRVAYGFYEAAAENGARPRTREYAATLEIDREASPPATTDKITVVIPGATEPIEDVPIAP